MDDGFLGAAARAAERDVPAHPACLPAAAFPLWDDEMATSPDGVLSTRRSITLQTLLRIPCCSVAHRFPTVRWYCYLRRTEECLLFHLSFQLGLFIGLQNCSCKVISGSDRQQELELDPSFVYATACISYS